MRHSKILATGAMVVREPIARAIPYAREAFGNRLRAFANFAQTPSIPGSDLQTRGREIGSSVPPHLGLMAVGS